jgi:hypothetical protein
MLLNEYNEYNKCCLAEVISLPLVTLYEGEFVTFFLVYLNPNQTDQGQVDHTVFDAKLVYITIFLRYAFL